MRRPPAPAACAAMAAAGAALLALGRSPGSPRPPSLPAPARAPAAAPVPQAPRAVPRTAPTGIVIPAIGVNAAVIPEGADASGALEVPPLTARDTAGWWDGGPAPGQDGAAVIAGHVDSAQAGPLVFWNLRLLAPGDRITVQPGGVTFTVTRVTQVSKAAFPTAAVYGRTTGPELRLVTCGGPFDQATGSYIDNVIVYAAEVKA